MSVMSIVLAFVSTICALGACTLLLAYQEERDVSRTGSAQRPH
jgi:hypothetical protein